MSVQLCSRPVLKTFDDPESAIRHATAVAENTMLVSVHSVEDVLLEPNGTRQADGFQYEYLALRQLCLSMASGMWRFVADVGGIVLRPTGSTTSHSPELAAAVFNRMVHLRFRGKYGPLGRQLVKNMDARTVDGVVGPGYQLLPNNSLLETAIETLESSDPPAGFLRAEFLGRRLAADFAFFDLDPLVVSGVRLLLGYSIHNSEAGECGVAVAPAVFVDGANARCTGKWLSLSHVGRDFQQRLRDMFGTAFDAIEHDTVRAKLARYGAQPLNLVAGTGVDTGRRKSLVRYLARHGVDRPVANVSVYDALFRGHQGSPVPQRVPLSSLRNRSLLDLAACLSRRARRLVPARREHTERVSYRLLTGALQISSLLTADSPTSP